MNELTLRNITAAIIGLVGWVGLFVLDPVIAILVFLIIWSNNLTRRSVC